MELDEAEYLEPVARIPANENERASAIWFVMPGRCWAEKEKQWWAAASSDCEAAAPGKKLSMSWNLRCGRKHHCWSRRASADVNTDDPKHGWRWLLGTVPRRQSIAAAGKEPRTLGTKSPLGMLHSPMIPQHLPGSRPGKSQKLTPCHCDKNWCHQSKSKCNSLLRESLERRQLLQPCLERPERLSIVQLWAPA